MQGKRTKWDSLGRLLELLEEKIRDHPDQMELTAKLLDVLSAANAVTASDPSGACHFKDGSCREIPEADCIAQGGIGWDGPNTTCPLPSGKASAQKVSTTV